MIIGMDFGTTNSGMAVFDGKRIQVLPLDPVNANPRVARTALYVTNNQEVMIGRAAVDNYFAHNMGRSVKLQRVWVGEVEVRGADMFFVMDLYIWTDVMSPGRLFLSMKTGLRDVNYAGTVIGQFFYSLEDLIALYLSTTKYRAEQQLKQPLNQVVLGRPVHFAFDPKQDALAQKRLLTAAFKAGYETVYFQYEPIAAAYSYTQTLTKPENVLVFDFGGGTLDITVMRLGEGLPRVLSTGGIPVAGDLFDQRLARAKLPRHFGEGSFYGSRQKPMPVPSWIYDIFSDWQQMIDLQRPDNRQILEAIAQTSRNPSEIQALMGLVSSNYGLKMFDQVEKAKQLLSHRFGATIHLQGPNFNLSEMVTRREFEEIIQAEVLAIERHLNETILRSGLRPEEIDVAIRTGGSSQIPVFQEMLGRKLGDEKLKEIDLFSSVTAGLGVIAHHVQAGEVALTAYRAGEEENAGTHQTQARVPEVNLSLLQRRIQAQELPEETNTQTIATHALILLGSQNQLRTTPWAEPFTSSLLSKLGWQFSSSPQTAYRLSLEHPLLVLTSRFRFLLTNPRQLGDLQALNLSLDDLYHFAGNETIAAMADWAQIKQMPLLVVVTSLGIARAYEMKVLANQIENPVPFRFDNPPEGVPAFLLPADRSQELLLFTNTSRAVRLPLSKLPNIGGQVLNRQAEELLVGAVCGNPATEWIVATSDGYGRRLKAEEVPASDRLNNRGRSILSRPNLCGITLASQPTWLLTTHRLTPIDPQPLPLEPSVKSYRLLKLAPNEQVIRAVASGN